MNCRALIDQQTAAFNKACVGQTLNVLFEKPGRNPGQIIGKIALSAAGAGECTGIADRHDCFGAIRIPTGYSLFGTLTAESGHARASACGPCSFGGLTPLRNYKPGQGAACRTKAKRRTCNPNHARLRRQQTRLGAVRPIRTEPRPDRAQARRGRAIHAATTSPSRERAKPAIRRGGCSRRFTSNSSNGGEIVAGDVEGAIRQAVAQGSLFDDDPATAALQFRRYLAYASARCAPAPRDRTLISARSNVIRWFSASARPARARPGSRSRMRSHCSNARKSIASSCHGRRWKLASGWASCPATCARRSTRICARSTTRCST